MRVRASRVRRVCVARRIYAIFTIALGGAAVESLPWKDVDNILVPFAVANVFIARGGAR